MAKPKKTTQKSTTQKSSKKADTNQKSKTSPKINKRQDLLHKIGQFRDTHNLSLNPLERLRRMTQTQKKIFAWSMVGVVLSVFLIVTTGIYKQIPKLWPSQKTEEDVVADAIKNTPEVQSKVNRLREIGQSVDPSSAVYEDIRYEDLPVYPIAWVERHFTLTESKNALISGPEGDPDRDGLPNKSEYLYGSNPKSQYSLCDPEKDDDERCKKTDNQNVESGISPLTGLSIDNENFLRISKQDTNMLSSIQNSFETAAREGVDFPTLYQLSKTIDLIDQVEEVKVSSVPDDRGSYVDYLETRLDVLEDFANYQGEFNGLIAIYNLNEIDELNRLQKGYDDQRTKLQQALAPESFIPSHKAYIFIYQKLDELIELRKSVLQDPESNTQEFKDESKKIAVEITWGFRHLDQELRLVELGAGEGE